MTNDFKSLRRTVKDRSWFDVLPIESSGYIPAFWSKGFELVMAPQKNSFGNTVSLQVLTPASKLWSEWGAVSTLATYDAVPQNALLEGLVSEDDKLRAVAWDKLCLNGDQGIPEEVYQKGFTDALECVRGAAMSTYVRMRWKKLPNDIAASGLKDKNQRIQGICLEDWAAHHTWKSLEDVKECLWSNPKGLQTHVLFGLAKNKRVVQQEDWLHWLWQTPGAPIREEIRMYALMNQELIFTPKFLKQDLRVDHLLTKKENLYLDMWVTHVNFNPTEEEIFQLAEFNAKATYPRSEWERIFLKKKTSGVGVGREVKHAAL